MSYIQSPSLKQKIAIYFNNTLRKINISKEDEKYVREEMLQSLTKCMDSYFRQKELELQEREAKVKELEDAIDTIRRIIDFRPKEYL